MKWPVGSGPIDFTILADRSTLEVFALGGLVSITNLVYPPAGARGIELRAEGTTGEIRVERWDLRSTWPR